MEPLPLTAYELIDWLNTHYPETIFEPGRMSHEEWLMKAGERRLVLTLIALRNAENDR